MHFHSGEKKQRQRDRDQEGYGTYVAGEVLGALVLGGGEVDGHDLVVGAGLLQRRRAPRHVPRHHRPVQLHRSHGLWLSPSEPNLPLLSSPLPCLFAWGFSAPRTRYAKWQPGGSRLYRRRAGTGRGARRRGQWAWLLFLGFFFLFLRRA